MSTLTVRPETRLLEARAEGEDPRNRPASAWLLCDVTAPEGKEPGSPRRPVNAALVLDRSGSMGGRPLDLARTGASLAVERLRPDDRMAVVVYDDRVDLLLRSTPATPEAKRRAAGLLATVRSGGSTDLHAGWLKGCEEVAGSMAPGSESRCLLLTDGLANQGVTDPAEIARHAGELRARGIVTSTFGLGDGFDEVLLQRMAEAGGGNAYWARDPEQIGPAMEAELGDSVETVARGVALVVEGAGVEEILVPGVGSLPRGADGRYRRGLGSLVAGQLRAEALHVRLRRERAGQETAVRFWLEDADGVLPHEERELAFAFEPPEIAHEAALDADVVVATRTALVHGLVLEALSVESLMETGTWLEKLDREAARLSLLAARVPGLAPVVDDLRKAAEDLADQAFLVDGHAVKEAFYRASYALKGRDGAGRARRGRAGLGLEVDLYGDGIDLTDVARLLDRRFRDAARGGLPVRIRFLEARPASAPETEPIGSWAVRGLLPAPDGGPPRPHAALVVTRRPLAENWFSDWDRDLLAGVVSLAGVDAATRAPLSAFLAYEAVLHGLRPGRSAWEPDVLMHDETRGCVFDLCAVRSDIDVKLHSASLCGVCRERLRNARVDTGIVDSLLAVVRDLSAAARATVN